MKTKFPGHLRKISVNYVGEIHPEILKCVSSRQVFFYCEMLKSNKSICSLFLAGIYITKYRSGEPVNLLVVEKGRKNSFNASSHFRFVGNTNKPSFSSFSFLQFIIKGANPITANGNNLRCVNQSTTFFKCQIFKPTLCLLIGDTSNFLVSRSLLRKGDQFHSGCVFCSELFAFSLTA